MRCGTVGETQAAVVANRRKLLPPRLPALSSRLTSLDSSVKTRKGVFQQNRFKSGHGPGIDGHRLPVANFRASIRLRPDSLPRRDSPPDPRMRAVACSGRARRIAGRSRGMHDGDVRECNDHRAVEQGCDEDCAQGADKYVVDSHVASVVGRVHTACVAVFDGR